jgi:hypothetical protein
MKQIVCSSGSRWTVGLVAVSILFCGLERGLAQEQTRRSSDGSRTTSVDMVALIAAPERYEGKIIRTVGFMSIEFEGDALYLHEEDYRYGLTKNSFALRLSESQRKQFKDLSLRYVLIEGTVFANGLEKTGKWSGAIGNIIRLEAWPVDRGASPNR